MGGRLRFLAVTLWAFALAYLLAVGVTWQRAHEAGQAWQAVAWGLLGGVFLFAVGVAVRQGWQEWKGQG